MSNNDTNTDLLIQYLDNELNDSAKAEVENRLATNQELKAQLTSLQLAREAVKLLGLKQQVKNIGAEYKRSHSVVVNARSGRVRRMGRWAIGIAAALLLVIVGIGLYEYSTVSNNKLYAQLYEPYEVRSARGSSTNDEVEAAYGAKNYQKTIASFQAQAQHSTADYFYAGQAFLQQNNLNEAINNMEHSLASSQTSHQFVDESEFYLALSYLKADDLSKAKPLFEKIHSDPNHLFHDKVNGLFMKRFYLLQKKSS